MTTPGEFTPPPADQPIPEPPPGGSTDRDLGGVIVDPEDYTPEEAAIMAALTGEQPATATGLPTWAKVLTLAMSQIAKYAPGRKRENVNRYTIAFYGTASIAAAWCFIFIWWVLDQLKGASLIEGKQAYVPWIDRIKGFLRGYRGMKPGAIVAIAGYSHIGFCTSKGTSTFRLLSGNSTNGSSSDAITIKSYPLSIASGFVNLAYATTSPTPAPTPTTAEDDEFAVGCV